MRPLYRTIYILCPANYVSGGPAALHQLASRLNDLGANALMSYIPYAANHTVPDFYRQHYGVHAAMPIDEPDNLIVIPEIYTKMALQFHKAKTAIWWLSVDHFVGYAGQNDNKRRQRFFLHDVRSLLRIPTSRLTWPQMRNIQNFASTVYAKEFLRSRGLASAPLCDPLDPTFLSVEPQSEKPRQNMIAYNTLKGTLYNAPVLEALDDIPKIELRGYTHDQLIDILQTVKVYIDFGYFPGSERMPREALLCGACIVIGQRGAAANSSDYPIPDYYKIDHKAPDFAQRARDAVLNIFSNFEKCSREFDLFRAYLKQGPEIFADQVRRVFFDLG
jgi:hypothetical protein